MKDNIMSFINKCESYKVSIKNLHWAADNMSEHKLCDDIAASISNNEDGIAEAAQGIYGKISKNELKPTTVKITTTKQMLENLLKDANMLHQTLDNQKEMGIKTILEDFISEIDIFIYLSTLCIKEDFKRKITNKLDEDKVRKTINESLIKIIKEADLNSMIKQKSHEKYHLNNGLTVEMDLEESTLTIYEDNQIISEWNGEKALSRIDYLINRWNNNGGQFEDTLSQIFTNE